MVRIGIPRAMSYYYLYPFFKTLLSDLGAETALSFPTTKSTLENLSACPTDEPCVAVKLYFAHVQQLLETDCDYIFLPKLIRVDKGSYCCPKFIGIPDMVKTAFGQESRILSPPIDVQNPEGMIQDLVQLTGSLGLNKKDVAKAIQHGWEVQREVSSLMASQGLTIEEAYKCFDGKRSIKSSHPPASHSSHTIGLIGHPYVLYEWISHDLPDRLRRYGKVITPEMIAETKIREEVQQIFEGEKLWTFEAQLLGAAFYLMKNQWVDRLVLVGLFECGPESIIEPYIEAMAEEMNIPLLKLFMDEQTGEAGLVTRIEAFMDMAVENREHTEKAGLSSSPVIPAVEHKKPIIGFPSMGRLDIVIDAILKQCGVETIRPPALSRRSIELGKELVPEFVCLPLTATLGQMIELLEMGVNGFLMVGGKGICRLGWYAQIQDMLLKRKGLSFDMTILDSPFPLNKNGSSFISSVKKITNHASWGTIGKSIGLAYYKLKLLDHGDELLRQFRAYEAERGQADRVYLKFQTQVDQCFSYRELLRLRRDFIQEMTSIAIEETEPLRIALVGEIWVLLEPFVNMGIERFLGRHPDVRVLVEREISVSHWLQSNLFHTPKAMSRTKAVHAAAAPYLSEQVGGHGIHSVGLSLLSAQEGVDGIIHLMPFTCMPEIVAQSILSQVTEKLDIPILSLIVSDQTGEAGFETRVDAFLDLLLERRYEKRKESVGNGILYRN